MTQLSNETYDKVKWVAQIALPAVGTLYFAIAAIWGLPKAEEVVGTITAIDAFLGVLLGLSKRSYDNSAATFDGTAEVQDTEDGPVILMHPMRLDDSEAITKLQEIRIKVNNKL